MRTCSRWRSSRPDKFRVRARQGPCTVHPHRDRRRGLDTFERGLRDRRETNETPERHLESRAACVLRGATAPRPALAAQPPGPPPRKADRILRTPREGGAAIGPTLILCVLRVSHPERLTRCRRALPNASSCSYELESLVACSPARRSAAARRRRNHAHARAFFAERCSAGEAAMKLGLATVSIRRERCQAMNHIAPPRGSMDSLTVLEGAPYLTLGRRPASGRAAELGAARCELSVRPSMRQDRSSPASEDVPAHGRAPQPAAWSHPRHGHLNA